MPTLSELDTLLGNSVGANLSFTDELNLVRARLIQSGHWKGLKEQITLPVYADAEGNSIVTLPREFDSILAGAIRDTNVLCSGAPMGVRNTWTEFSKGGLGYGGLTNDFQEVTGRFSVFQEWDTPMRIRVKFERSESSGTLYLRGTLDGEDVWALNTATWEKREAIAYSGTTTQTSTKYYDAYRFKVDKPVTNGRVSLYAVDDDDNETLVSVIEPSEKSPRWKRYKVPECSDTSAVTSTTATTPSQFYTKAELDAMFSTESAITVSSAGTHDLVYSAYLLRVVPITASAGVGTYTHTFTLDNATVKNGGTLRIRLEIAASANPTLEFYDNTLAGTLLYSVSGDSSNARYETLVFSYDGTNWSYEGREVI